MRTDPAASLNIDSRSLDSLRSEAQRNPKAAAHQAAVAAGAARRLGRNPRGTRRAL